MLTFSDLNCISHCCMCTLATEEAISQLVGWRQNIDIWTYQFFRGENSRHNFPSRVVIKIYYISFHVSAWSRREWEDIHSRDFDDTNIEWVEKSVTWSGEWMWRICTHVTRKTGLERQWWKKLKHFSHCWLRDIISRLKIHSIVLVFINNVN